MDSGKADGEFRKEKAASLKHESLIQKSVNGQIESLNRESCEIGKRKCDPEEDSGQAEHVKRRPDCAQSVGYTRALSCQSKTGGDSSCSNLTCCLS